MKSSNSPKFFCAGEILRKPATERSKEDLDELFGWWLGVHDAEYRNLEKQTEALVHEDAEIKARGTIAHVMHEKPAAPMAYVLYRGDYDKRRDAVTARHAGRPARPSPPTCRATGSASPSGCCGPNIR